MSGDLLPSSEPVDWGDGRDLKERFDRSIKHHRSYKSGQDWALPEVEAFTGIVEEYRYNEETGAVDYTRTQDISAIIDDCHEHRAGNFEGWKKKEDKWVAMASIPNLVIEETMKTEGWSVYDAKCDRNGVPNDQMRKVLKKLRGDWACFKKHDMDFGDGRGMGNTRLAHIPANGLIWPTKDGL